MKRFLKFSFILILILSFKNVALAQDYWKHYDAPYYSVKFSQADSNYLVAAGNSNGIYKSTNGGQSWINVLPLANTGGAYLRINDIAFPTQNLIIAVADSIRNINLPGQNNNFANSACILRSEDGGVTWTLQNFGKIEDGNPRIFSNIIMNNADNGVIAQHWHDTSNKQDRLPPLLYTTDGGISWEPCQSPDVNFAILMSKSEPGDHPVSSPSPGVWFVYGRDYNGQANVLWNSNNYGKSWSKLNVPIEQTNKILFLDSLIGYAIGAQTNLRIPVFAKTIDGGLIWQKLVFENRNYSTGFIDFDFYDRNNGIISAYDSILCTKDGGITWKGEFTGLTDSSRRQGTAVYRILYSGQNNAIGMARDGIMIKYIPAGILKQPHMTTPKVISFIGGRIDEFAVPGKMWWREVQGAKKYYVQISKYPFTFASPDSNIIYNDSTLVNSIDIPGTLFIPNLPYPTDYNYYVRVCAISAESKSNWSFPFQFKLVKAVSGVQEISELLGKPYPNPANNIIYIPFKTTNESEISVMISDALGKSINTFKSSYSLSHNAIMLSDLEQLPNGIYLVQISQGNQQQTSMINISK